MTIQLIPLPYPANALEPDISQKTLDLHHGAHHKTYIDKTNDAIAGTELADADLNAIVTASKGDAKLFNSASQSWNHGFYWHSLSPEKTTPSAKLQEAIDRDFGSIEALKKALQDKAVAHFASGWAWLVAKDGKLAVVDSHDAASPFSEGEGNPLLTIDVWEHAYYVDVLNKRPEYVRVVVENRLNWRFASENYERGSAWLYPSETASQPAGLVDAK
jgi:Fe-Mn family superoxide dismutase